METNDLIGKIRVQTHAWTMVDMLVRHVLVVLGIVSRATHARATGKLVMKPKRKDDRPDIAAVAVIRSRLTSGCMSVQSIGYAHRTLEMLCNSPNKHKLYSVSFRQVGSSGSLHTHVPPESARIDALTEMMYALDISSAFNKSNIFDIEENSHREESRDASANFAHEARVRHFFLLSPLSETMP